MSRFVSKKLTVSVAEDLIIKIDNLARAEFSSRSDVVRRALLQYLYDPINMAKADPNSAAAKKAYDFIKDDHPYLDPDDVELIQVLVAQKIKNQAPPNDQ